MSTPITKINAREMRVSGSTKESFRIYELSIIGRILLRYVDNYVHVPQLILGAPIPYVFK